MTDPRSLPELPELTALDVLNRLTIDRFTTGQFIVAKYVEYHGFGDDGIKRVTVLRELLPLLRALEASGDIERRPTRQHRRNPSYRLTTAGLRRRNTENQAITSDMRRPARPR